jgi:uncharacterized membrane protein YedE/YeeE
MTTLRVGALVAARPDPTAPPASPTSCSPPADGRRRGATVIAAGACGLLFGLGLVVSGMTRQDKVIGFLDVAGGAWDPSLALVMVGAIGVHALALRVLASRARPLLAESFQAPVKTAIDTRLVAGAALFGVGWGLGGVCPGPALVACATWAPSVLLFAAGLVVGLAACARTVGRVTG